MASTLHSLQSRSRWPFVLFLILLSFVFIMGCGQVDQGTGPDRGTASPPPKALPEYCDDGEFMPLDFSWTSEREALYYEIEFGYKNRAPMDKLRGDAKYVMYSFAEGQRGRTYTFAVTLKDRSGRESTESRNIFIPKCADRQAYQDTHPDYAEPIAVWIFFNAQ